MEKVNVVDVVENFIKFGSEAAAGRVLKKKVFSEISQNSQKNSFARVSSLMKFFLLKKRLWCFPVNFAKFLRTTFLQNTSRRLPLSVPFEINK